MHLQRSYSYKEPWTRKLLLLVMVAQHVADVLTKETFNAFAELLHTIDIPLIHLPLDSGVRLKRRDPLVHLVVPRHVRHQVLDHRKRLEGVDRDGLVSG